MKYRLLDACEYGRLSPIFAQHAPVPDLSYVAIAEKDGAIISVVNTHLQLHLDHFWIAPDSGYVDWRELWNTVEGRFPSVDGLRVYAAPTFKNGERMCEIVGFKKPEVSVMVKEY